MADSASRRRGAWRTFTKWYAWTLSQILAVMLVVLVIPVALQIFSRYQIPFTEIAMAPRYIWTEEIARLLFVWVIMMGSIIGVYENAHFDCDLWPDFGPRADAFGRLLGRFGVLGTACVFIWAGIEFTKFAWNRTSELGDLPLWYIHIAWPIAGVSWIVFLGEQMMDDLRIVRGRPPIDPVKKFSV